jgi:vitamin K-dependent gamma-carboxylase-like protein
MNAGTWLERGAEASVVRRLAAAATSFTRALGELFTADTRSLAMARIGVAVTVLVDLVLRAPDLIAFYTDHGLLPRAQWLAAYRHAWSLHVISGSAVAIGALFAVHALAALALLVGARARLATAVVWLLTASLHARNPVVLQGGDSVLLLLLFWGMFVPWGARFSIDAAARRPGKREVLSAGTVGLMLQMPLVYFVAAFQKSGPDWRSTFSAVYYALNDDFIASRFGLLLGQAPMWLLQALCVGTLVLEAALPMMLFFPVATRQMRWAALAIAAVLQIGFALSFNIGLFPLMSSVALLVFVPGTAWTWLDRRRAHRRLRDRVTARCAALPRWLRASSSTRRRPWAEAVCALAVALVLWSNAAALGVAPLPRSLAHVAGTVRLSQGWKMFVQVRHRRGWYVAVGEAEDGREVDLLTGDTHMVQWDKPDLVSESFGSYRWRKYFGNLGQRRMKAQHPAFARFLCREWNATHDRGDRIQAVRIYYSTEPIGTRDAAGPTRTRILEQRCGRARGAAGRT